MEQITTARLGLCRLMRQGETFYITLPTSNQFDEPFIFYIGEGKDSAVQTLNDLVDLCGTIEKGSPIVVDNGKDSCTISKGMGTLNLRQEGYAGYAELAKAELQKYIKSIKALKE